MVSEYGTNASTIQVQISKPVVKLQKWEFPGWGCQESVIVPEDELRVSHDRMSKTHTKLSEWPATAICGNDILSSCLYVSGLVAGKAGKLAPVALAMVAAILYLYRFIYGEVVSAIPLNGGSYNVLLNTTSKRIASFAASLAILSYLATGVVSGTSACTYLATQFPSINVVTSTILLLFFFAVLSFIGITESSMVALLMFIIHTFTLITLCVLSFIKIIGNTDIFWENMSTNYPDVNLAGNIVSGNVFTALFFGLATAMLGISGFESSSQFVEEQKDGVFVKTLRNMWWAVAIFNPMLSLLSLGVMPLNGDGSISEHQNTVLANMGYVVGGSFMETWVSIDAFVVLSGAVLTAYVGITGLVRRLACDRVLPGFLLYQNSWRRTNHYIIFGYFLIASSLVLILNGDVVTLSGVYTYAFLGLMTLFACGCMLLKFKRAEIPRIVIAPWWSCISGIVLVFCGFLGNLLGDPTVLTYFSVYFLTVLIVVMVMFERSFLLRIALYTMKRICPSRKLPGRDDEFADGVLLKQTSSTGARGGRTIAKTLKDINNPPILFYCKKPDLSTINKAILYVRQNEQTSNLRIVHVTDEHEEIGTNDSIANFAHIVSMFDIIYPKLRIDFLVLKGSFGPSIIDWVSYSYSIPKNMMFIKQPDHQFAHKIESLGGVRVITG